MGGAVGVQSLSLAIGSGIAMHLGTGGGMGSGRTATGGGALGSGTTGSGIGRGAAGKAGTQIGSGGPPLAGNPGGSSGGGSNLPGGTPPVAAADTQGQVPLPNRLMSLHCLKLKEN